MKTMRINDMIAGKDMPAEMASWVDRTTDRLHEMFRRMDWHWGIDGSRVPTQTEMLTHVRSLMRQTAHNLAADAGRLHAGLSAGRVYVQAQRSDLDPEWVVFRIMVEVLTD